MPVSPTVFHQIPQITNDAVLTKSYLSTAADNRRYLVGLCDRLRPIPEGVDMAMTQSSGRQAIWRGWFFKQEHNETLTYRYNCAGAWASGTVDVSGLTDDQFYYCEWALTDSPKLEFWFNGSKEADPAWTDPTAQVVPPYCDWNGNLSYFDNRGNFSGSATPGDFLGLELNDFYHEENIPPRYPGMAVRKVGFDLGTEDKTLWTGYVPYDSRLKRMWYKIGVEPHPQETANSANTKIEIVWDPDGSAEVIGDVSMNISTRLLIQEESYHDLTGGYSNGTWYKVICRLNRGNQDDGHAYGYFHYLYRAPQTPLSGITDPGEWSPNSTVQSADLEKLNDLDHLIQANLIRQDWATRWAQSPGHYWDTVYGVRYGHYHIRMGDHLYYKGIGVKVTAAAGGRAIALPDSEDSISAYDLNGIKGLHYGMHYRVDGLVEFSMEV